MKNYTSLTALSLFLFSFLIIIHSCKRDDNTGGCKNPSAIVRIHDFNPAYYSHIMVYKHADSVRFLKNGLDTVVFVAGPIQNLDEIIPAQNGCGKESFKAVKQILISPSDDSIELIYSMMLNYNFDYDQFSIRFDNEDLSQFPQYIVNCDPGSSSITVLGKTYCVGKLGIDQTGKTIIYYAKDYGIVKVSKDNYMLELIPK